MDDLDRRILGELSRDALQSYAAISLSVGLSAPAVHERVKRMRASGMIKGTVAQIDGALVGKPLLAFIHVDTIGWARRVPCWRWMPGPRLRKFIPPPVTPA